MESDHYSEANVRQHLTSLENRIGKRVISCDHQEFEYLFTLLKRHPSYETWKKRYPTAFKITRSRGNNAIQLNVSFTLKLEGVVWKPKFRLVSWVACAKMKVKKSINDPLQQLTSAMRYAVRIQIKNYRKSNPNAICALKGDNHCEYTRLEVDHYPERFVSLRDEFIRLQDQRHRELPQNFKWHPKRGSMMFLKKDLKWKQAWQRYHRKNARYRFLCPTCNKKSTASTSASKC